MIWLKRFHVIVALIQAKGMIDNMGREINEKREIPLIYKIRQRFEEKKIDDIPSHIIAQINSLKTEKKLQNKRIAIAIGSRGINNLAQIVKAVVYQLIEMGAEPFIVPAMGSHGGGIAENQVKILKNYGITREEIGIPIESSMEVIKIGEVGRENVPVYFDKIAMNADGIVVINRIKPHTSMNAEIESGLIKMLVIGLGNHEGASSIHSHGITGLNELIVEAGKIIIEKVPILWGVAIVEDAYDNTSVIEIIKPSDIFRREKELLSEAYKRLPTLPVSEIDLLVVNEIGKNISGTGLDTNIIGRFAIWELHNLCKPKIKKIAALNLSSKSEGNALGVGLVDIVTRRLIDAMDYKSTIINAITGTFLQRAFIPIIVEDDYEAITLGIDCSRRWDPLNARIVRINNTLNLNEIEVSKSVWNEIKEVENIETISGPYVWQFDKGILR